MYRWDTLFKYAPATVTALVAVCVAVIAYRQWRTAQERLRFDLYNRRFDIYSRVLDFYHELLVWQGTPDQKALQLPFWKASREARFVFPVEVFNILQDFSTRAFAITQFENLKPFLGSIGVEESIKRVNQRTDDVNWILTSLEKLETSMAPYLDFHKF